MDLRDIYGTLHQIQKNILFNQHLCIFLQSGSHSWAESKSQQMKQIEITLSHHHGLNLDMNNNRKNKKLTKSWKLSNSVMNEKWVKAKTIERY